MIGDILQPTHLLFILVIALLVLGPKRLPEAGRSLGRGLRDFKDALSGDDREQHDELPTAAGAPAATAASAPPPAAPPTDADVAPAASAPAATATSAPPATAEPVPEPAKPAGA